MTHRFLNYGRQLIDEDDLESVLNVLRGDFLTQGPAVEQFENSICQYTGAKYAVAVSSGTAALHVACLAAGIKKNDVGVTSTLTFIASANAYLYCGGDANVVDINPDHLGLSTEKLRHAISKNAHIKAVTPVHFGGLACDTEKIREIVGDRIIIEDASHSLGGKYENGSAVGKGTEADMTVFSFHPVKPITTGEGGAIVTNNAELYRRLKMFSNHGIERQKDRFVFAEEARNEPQLNPWYYEQQELGFNYRMSDLHAALGHVQLKKLDQFISRRREIAAMYDEAFASLPEITLPQSNPSARQRSAHHLYVAEFDFDGMRMTRPEFVDKMRGYQVGGQIHYIPVHRQPYQINRYKYVNSTFSAAENHYSKCLSLPIHAGLTDAEANRVIDAVKSILKNRNAD